ncbi:MAG TPA: S1 RNA-binding domain-containing protein, partial [Bacteroidetes bacterium]|nr:S1 RNA-binding domain-containing protein [Bacteroidota bacterium]
MSANLMGSLAELASLKQLNKEQLAEIIKDGLYQAISKKLLLESELTIVADFDTNRVCARFNRIVVERDMSLGEISLEEAKDYDPDIELGDKIPVEMTISDFEPKVIRNARKAILERIKALEEDRIMFDYENQKNQIISGKVTKDDYNGYVVDISYADALLPKEEQIEDEFFKVGDIVKAYVVNIRKRKNDVIVILSRTRPEFVKRIFETEIPEINSGEIV